MTKNTAKIKDGLYNLAGRLNEIASGTVLAGSTDTEAYTISVQQTGSNIVIEGVLLNAISGENNGMILIPKDGSSVIIGSVDGQGEWVLLRASAIDKAIIKVENTLLEINDTDITLKNGNVVLDIGNTLFKLNTSSESLFSILNDLITAIAALTVITSGSTSSVPVNVTAFDNLLVRLGNLLSA